jgi:hypothetical protein
MESMRLFTTKRFNDYKILLEENARKMNLNNSDAQKWLRNEFPVPVLRENSKQLIRTDIRPSEKNTLNNLNISEMKVETYSVAFSGNEKWFEIVPKDNRIDQVNIQAEIKGKSLHFEICGEISGSDIILEIETELRKLNNNFSDFISSTFSESTGKSQTP